MRSFPAKFESKKEVLFYPRQPELCTGDILEIGPGRGDFLLSIASHRPGEKIVAVELEKKRYFKLIPRIEKSGLTNVLLIHGNARIILPRYFRPDSFDKIYVLFPDPWPKRRHLPHRLMSVEFIELLADLLRPDGELYTATDFWPYAEMVVDNAGRVSRLSNLGMPYFTTIAHLPYYNPSFYEQKWQHEGRAIYYIRFRKR
jgi:tRNA (guanine-N7-)-methyltransferase